MGLDSNLIHLCDIQRGVAQPDGYGNDTLVWPPVVPLHLLDVRCRLVIKEQRVGDTALADRPVVTIYRLFLPPQVNGNPTDVRQGDRVVNLRDETGAAVPGTFRIPDEVMPRRARAVRHYSLKLERLGGT